MTRGCPRLLAYPDRLDRPRSQRAALYISETTVKTHVTHILAKLGLRDRVQAVVVAYQSGVIDADARI